MKAKIVPMSFVIVLVLFHVFANAYRVNTVYTLTYLCAWGLFLYCGVKMKSKEILRLYRAFWLLLIIYFFAIFLFAAIAFVFAAIAMNSYSEIAFIIGFVIGSIVHILVAGWLMILGPLLGVPGSLFVPFLMFLLGVIMKRKFIK